MMQTGATMMMSMTMSSATWTKKHVLRREGAGRWNRADDEV